jgi:hypothetical protein
VTNESSDIVAERLPAVCAIDRFAGVQMSEVIKEFVTFVILAVKHPKAVLRFGHTQVYHTAERTNGANVRWGYQVIQAKGDRIFRVQLSTEVQR